MTDKQPPSHICHACGAKTPRNAGWDNDKRVHDDLPRWAGNVATYGKAYRDKRRAAGLCVACGYKWQGKSATCDECRHIAATKARIKRNNLKQEGVCLRCRKAPPARNKLHCQSCIKARYNRKPAK